MDYETKRLKKLEWLRKKFKNQVFPDNYNTITENPKYFILNKRIEKKGRQVFLPYGNGIKVLYVEDPTDKKMYISQIFYPKKFYQRGDIEKAWSKKSFCHYCVQGEYIIGDAGVEINISRNNDKSSINNPRKGKHFKKENKMSQELEKAMGPIDKALKDALNQTIGQTDFTPTDIGSSMLISNLSDAGIKTISKNKLGRILFKSIVGGLSMVIPIIQHQTEKQEATKTFFSKLKSPRLERTSFLTGANILMSLMGDLVDPAVKLSMGIPFQETDLAQQWDSFVSDLMSQDPVKALSNLLDPKIKEAIGINSFGLSSPRPIGLNTDYRLRFDALSEPKENINPMPIGLKDEKGIGGIIRIKNITS